MKQLKKILFILTCAFLLAQLSSCSSVSRSSFSKKKYTNYRTAKTQKLKTNSVENGNVVVASTGTNSILETAAELRSSSIDSGIDPTENVTHDSDKNQIGHSEAGTKEKSSEDLASENLFSESENETEGVESTESVGHRNNFERLSKEQQVQRLIEFNALFNTTAVLMIIGGFLGLLGILNFIFLIPAGIALIVGWILSLVATTKVKRIDASKQSKNFQNKRNWFIVLRVIGTLVAVATIVGGVLLLIIWLARGI